MHVNSCSFVFRSKRSYEQVTEEYFSRISRAVFASFMQSAVVKITCRLKSTDWSVC